jgi:hypothetical protein
MWSAIAIHRVSPFMSSFARTNPYHHIPNLPLARIYSITKFKHTVTILQPKDRSCALESGQGADKEQTSTTGEKRLATYTFQAYIILLPFFP